MSDFKPTGVTAAQPLATAHESQPSLMSLHARQRTRASNAVESLCLTHPASSACCRRGVPGKRASSLQCPLAALAQEISPAGPRWRFSRGPCPPTAAGSRRHFERPAASPPPSAGGPHPPSAPLGLPAALARQGRRALALHRRLAAWNRAQPRLSARCGAARSGGQPASSSVNLGKLQWTPWCARKYPRNPSCPRGEAGVCGLALPGPGKLTLMT